MQEIIKEAAPVRIWFGRKANSFWERPVNIRSRKCEAVDPRSDNVHHWSGQNETTPQNSDIHVPSGNTDTKLRDIERHLLCAPWQAPYVLDLELAHVLFGRRQIAGGVFRRKSTSLLISLSAYSRTRQVRVCDTRMRTNHDQCR